MVHVLRMNCCQQPRRLVLVMMCRHDRSTKYSTRCRQVCMHIDDQTSAVSSRCMAANQVIVYSFTRRRSTVRFHFF